MAVAQQVVLVILDDSGSMKETMRADGKRVSRMEAAKAALQQVVGSLPPDTIFGVRLLNGLMSQRDLIALARIDQSSAARKIATLLAGGGTPLGDSLKQAGDDLLQYRKTHQYGTYRLLVISDGEANDSELVDRYLPMLQARGLIVDVIGVDMKNDLSLASSVHAYRRVDDAGNFAQTIQSILAESQTDQDSIDDFAILNQLPDAVAAEAITTLSSVENAPLTRANFDNQIARNVQASKPDAGLTVNVENGFQILSCCGIVPCLFFVVVIIIVLRIIKRRR